MESGGILMYLAGVGVGGGGGILPLPAALMCVNDFDMSYVK
jgi:hypothetical protein